MDAGMATAIASIIVAAVAALGAWASQRAAARASQLNTSTTSRVEAEKGAYERARAFDVETIGRQNKEIDELRLEVESLRSQNADLRNRVYRLENGHFLPLIAKQEDRND